MYSDSEELHQVWGSKNGDIILDWAGDFFNMKPALQTELAVTNEKCCQIKEEQMQKVQDAAFLCFLLKL